MPAPRRRIVRGLASPSGFVAAMLSLAVLFLLALPATSHAQALSCEEGDTEVRRVRFSGNETFSDQELADSIVTTGENWFRRNLGFFGRRQCLDEEELQRDVLRLIIFYRLNGFYGVQVSPQTRPVSGGVDVEFDIVEGQPIILDSLAITGLPSADSARIVRGLEFPVGERYSRYLAARNVREIITRLRNDGYPRADALIAQTVDTVDKIASLHIDVQPGDRARIGEIRVLVEPAEGKEQEISSNTVRRITGLRPGALYRERDLVDAQRTLYQLDAYRHVEVRLAPDSLQRADTLVTVDLGLIEGDMGSARVGVGWATLDCFRTQAGYTDRNFLGGARRMELNGRLWKIGARQSWKPCDAVDEDPFSENLNYNVSATFSQPTLFGRGPRSLPSITVYSERRSEFLAFERLTSIGLLVSQRIEPFAQVPVVLSYSTENGKTEAPPALFCAVFAVCVEEDRAQLEDWQWLAVAGASVVRDRTDNPFSPTRGSVVRVDFRHASPLIGSSREVRFNKLVADGSRYWSVADGQVLAARLRLGGVLGADLADAEHFIPPQERLYAGGPSTVRGYAQNELGPILYRADAYDTLPGPGDTVYYRADPDSIGAEVIPKGGNTMIVGNLEYRLRSPFFPDLLQWTAFVDGGLVWNRESDPFRWTDVRWTPGIGVRAFTLIGAVRVDVGYNPYARRPGAAYFDAPLDDTGNAPLFCVSPGNTIPIVNGQPPLPGEEQSCPESYAPRQGGSFFQRLNFSFSIGQAF